MQKCVANQSINNNTSAPSSEATGTATTIHSSSTMETKYEQLQSFLETVKVKRGEKSTHTNLQGKYKTIYNISDSKMETFMELYSDAMIELQQQGKHMSITEKHIEQGPIMIDLDFRSSTNEPVYTQDDVKNFIQAINKLLFATLDIEVSDMDCYVMENNNIRKNGEEYKSGLHLMYPFVCTTPDVMFAIRDDIINQHNEGTLECFQNKNLVNQIDDIFDKAVIKSNNWFLYGSGKCESKPYLLTTIYNDTVEPMTLGDFDFTTLPIMCSIRKFDQDDRLVVKSTSKIISCGSSCVNEAPVASMTVNQTLPEQINQPSSLFESSNSIVVENARALTAILSKKRANSRDGWISVGFCLHNIDRNLLSTWDDFSKKSKKYKKGECAKLWETMKYDGYQIGSLHLWAKQDNPKEYNEFRRKRVQESIQESLRHPSGGAHYDIAKVLYDSYNGQFAFTMSEKAKMWYEFQNHRWESIENGISLRNKIPEELVDQYLKHAHKLMQESIPLPEGNADKDKNLKHVELCQKMRNKLRTTPYQNNVMSQCENLFHDQKLLKKLDENKNLLGFNNGTYDILNNEFRPGRPEDFITMTTNINYIPLEEGLKDTDFKRRYREVDTFLGQIMPDPDMKQYIIDFLASSLWGNVKDESFPIWEGTGSNGKSLLVQLMEETLGDYKCTLPISILTQKRNASNAASPELAQIQGKRFGVYQEPEPNAVIHVGHMKELTGGDKISCRALFQGIREFHPQITQVLLCNKLPKIPSNDGGTWRRLKAVNFGQKFVDNPTKANEHQIDRSLKEKIKTWVEPFMSLLINRLPYYLEHGLKEPAQVTQHTKNYQQESDVMLEFINDNIETTDDPNDRLRVSDVYTAFKNWYRENYSDNRCPSKSEMKTHLVNTVRPLEKKMWVGLRLTTYEGEGLFSSKPQNSIVSALDKM